MNQNTRYVWTVWIIALAATVYGAVVAWEQVAGQSVDFGISLLVSAIGIAVITLLLRRSALWPSAPLGWYGAALLWGSVAAFFIAGPVGRAWFQIVDATGMGLLRNSFGGAYAEEILKTLGVALILMGFARLSRPWHGLVVGVIVGLGFDAIENTFFALDAARFDPNANMDGLISSWISRLLVGPGLHMIFTAFAGLGLGYAIFAAERSLKWRIGVATAGIGAGFLAHFAWNVGWENEAVRLMWAVGLSALIYGGFIVICRRELKRARADREHEQESGLEL